MPMAAPAAIGQALEGVDTPALVIDLAAFERNLATLAATVEGRGVRVRAHAKTHKSPEIAQRQIAAGAIGMCCQKVSEAEVLVAGGVGDVLVTNEIVGAAKLARLAALAGRARIGVCIDDAGNARAVDAAAAAAGTQIDAYIEIDVGAKRCGIAPGAPALALARVVAACRNLRLAGLQAYQGSVQHLRPLAERRSAIERAASAANQTRRLLESEGIACPVVTGGGSGTFMFEVASGVYDEIQPGSYIFMDADYAKNEWGPPLPRFEHALFVLTTVMSRPAADRAVVDAGLKASSVDSGLPLVWERPGLRYTRPSDEHGVIEIAAGAAAPALGEKLMLVPGHCDPTVNLHDWYVGVRDGKVEALWPVAARGALF
ncbi:MAG: DSD1 family PLP-dependent enzyme [Burkholderiales bacterium]